MYISPVTHRTPDITLRVTDEPQPAKPSHSQATAKPQPSHSQATACLEHISLATEAVAAV